jgi:hypothetical protein
VYFDFQEEGTMKIRLLLTLAGLVIGFALPTVGQEQKAVDPEVRQQIEAVITKFDEAYNNTTRLLLQSYTLWTRLNFGRGKGWLPVGKP